MHEHLLVSMLALYVGKIFLLRFCFPILELFFILAIFWLSLCFDFSQSTSGVVFGFMSLMSYLTNGALISTIQNLFPEER